MDSKTRTKQILIVTLTAVTLGVLGFFLYRFFAPATPTPGGVAPTSIFGRLPVIGGRIGPTPVPEGEVMPGGGIPAR